MKEHEATVRAAIALLLTPSRVRIDRELPLPSNIGLLVRIVAGEAEALGIAAATSDHPPEVVAKAAAFFVEQIMLAPGADSYRVLGGDPTSSASELRRNMALLLKWLHPDVISADEKSIYAARVTRAWGDLKTPESRAAYDRQLATTVQLVGVTPRVSARARLVKQQKKRAKLAADRGYGQFRAPGFSRRIMSYFFGRQEK